MNNSRVFALLLFDLAGRNVVILSRIRERRDKRPENDPDLAREGSDDIRVNRSFVSKPCTRLPRRQVQKLKHRPDGKSGDRQRQHPTVAETLQPLISEGANAQS